MLFTIILGASAVCASRVFKRAQLKDPFDILDPQRWVKSEDMTWADYKAPPGTNWADPSRKGSIRNFNIALVTIDFKDRPFAVTLPPNSTLFGNPLPLVANMPRQDVPNYYRDLLNKPSKINHNHTLHEYWMEDSAGRFGVDLKAFGPYRMPKHYFQYGVDFYYMNKGACPNPSETPCVGDTREDSIDMWESDVGKQAASSFDLVFILGAGEDEYSTWREFGEMKFNSKEEIPDAFGPPRELTGNNSLPNYASTRNHQWTSWAAAANVWPNAWNGTTQQCETSGLGVYAHELSHILNIMDNYITNPDASPLQRDYTGPWSMMSSGASNGPGGIHSAWHIPSLQGGGTMGSLHTMRDKQQLGLAGPETMLRLSRKELNNLGPIVANVTARSVVADLMGLRIELDADLSPACNVSTDVLCDGGGYENYEMEVIDRMGSDSFQPDAGVMISKTKNNGNQDPFQWTVDANPQDIDLIDFHRPNGTAVMVSLGDARQLNDALFHAGTRSGSKFDHLDESNGLHFYILNKYRDEAGILSYTVGARPLNNTSKSTHSINLTAGKPDTIKYPTETGIALFCTFSLTNNGSYLPGMTSPQPLLPYLGSEIYRLQVEIEGSGWHVELPNALAVAKFGQSVDINVAVGATANAQSEAKVTLMAISESDPRVTQRSECKVSLS
ncbi:mucin [Drechmeria coniospora]|uniref:Mucin n=1 Tax=Drechmeria coniospora TaxID=98403 RepID=A0A151GYK6_DRECN|nr:mucin [Drechmeria coniospora]KYK62112.1 mucin [Drechmeria coniospora]